MVNMNEIKEILPHRYPFLLVDKVEETTESKAVTYRNVTISEPFSQGHLPDYPIMPGVLIVGALAQTGAITLLNKEELKEKTPFFAGIDRVGFRKQILPGDTLRLEVEIIESRESTGLGETTATIDGEIAYSGEIMSTIG